MNEHYPAAKTSETSSELDRQIDAAETSRRNRMSKWLGRKVLGLDPSIHGVEVVSGRVKNLREIKKAENPQEEVDRQLAAAESTRRARVTKWLGRKVTGLNLEEHGAEVVSGKVARLRAIQKDMQAAKSAADYDARVQAFNEQYPPLSPQELRPDPFAIDPFDQVETTDNTLPAAHGEDPFAAPAPSSAASKRSANPFA